MRYKIELSYIGTHFGGWQIQNNAPSVQETLQKVLGAICDEPIDLVGCGRTDSGVHASQFFAHFDTHKPIPSNIPHRVNRLLPNEIAVISCEICEPNFHARYSAIQREYQYHICSQKNPFTANTCWWTAKTPNVVKMNACATILLGEHPFTSFCKGEIPNGNPLCTIYKAEWICTDTGYTFTIISNRFLRNMVRSLVGFLLEVGLETMSKEEFTHIFMKAERAENGHSVPAEGLCLSRVVY